MIGPRRSEERGSAAVEFALVFMFLLMIALGAFEYGMAFRDSLAVSSSAREAARVGAAAGDRTEADCIILEAAAGALHSIAGNQVAELWIYRSDTSGTVSGTRQMFRPAVDTDDPTVLVCGGWFTMAGSNWAPAARDNDGTTRDWLGVKITYDHEWHTGFLWWTGTARWAEDAVMRLEPSI